MKLPICARLLACAASVPVGSRVADIGCDHGYLGIYLLQRGIAQCVIASDINQGPLLAAQRNALKYGCADRMRFFISDGVRNIPHEFDTLVCAGMGADTMISVLRCAAWLQDKRYTLILQCQTKTHLLRRYLSDNGWHIGNEVIVRDGKFLYNVMCVSYDPTQPRLSAGECYFPTATLKPPTAESIEQYQRVCKNLRIIVNARRHSAAFEYAALQELEALGQACGLQPFEEKDT